MGSQMQIIEDRHTIHWPNEKEQKDKHIRRVLWHRCSVTVNHVRCDDFNVATRNPWLSNFLYKGGKCTILNTVSTESYILHIQVVLQCCYL